MASNEKQYTEAPERVECSLSSPSSSCDVMQAPNEQERILQEILPSDITVVPSVQIGALLSADGSVESSDDCKADGEIDPNSNTDLDGKDQEARRKRKCRLKIFVQHATPMKVMIFYYALTAAVPTMDIAISTVAMPTIATEYGIDISLTQWIAVAMNLGCAVSGTIAGRFLERFGSINMFSAWSLLIMVTSLASAFMPGFYSLLLMRFISGFAITGMSVTKGYIFRLLPYPDKVKLGLFLTIILFNLGAIISPLATGFIIQHMGWRACYILCSILAGLTYLSMAFVHDPFARAEKKKTDFGGIILLSCAYIVSSLSASMFGQQLFLVGILLLVAGCAFFIGFIIQERRIAHPLIPLNILTGPLKPLLSIHVLIVFYRNATRMLIPFIYSIIYERSSVFVGVLNSVFGVMDTVSSCIIPALDKRYTTRQIFLTCLVAVTVCTAAFPFVVYNQLYLSLALFITAFTFLDIVTSMCWAVILTTAPVSQLAVVSVLPNLSKTLACSVCTCIVSSLHSLVLQGDYGDLYPVTGDPYYKISYIRAMSICMAFLFVDVLFVTIIAFLGLYNYEADRGKRGFSEKRLRLFTA